MSSIPENHVNNYFSNTNTISFPQLFTMITHYNALIIYFESSILILVKNITERAPDAILESTVSFVLEKLRRALDPYSFYINV